MTVTIDGDREGLLALTTDPNEEVWRTLLDAVAGVAEATGTTLRVPGWAIPSMAWWWATAEVAANEPRLTERARARINMATQRADR